MAPSVTNSDATNTTTIVQFNPVTQLTIRLAGSHNFSLWKAQVSMLMRGHNLHGHLDGTIFAPAETTNYTWQLPTPIMLIGFVRTS